MRKTLVVTLSALAALAAGAGTAGAKEANLTMTLPPGGPPGPGSPWPATVHAEAEPAALAAELRPFVTIENVATGEQRVFHARPTGEDGTYRVAIVFPADGTWRTTLADGMSDREYVQRAVTVGGPPAGQPAADGGDGPGPGWIAGAAAALLAAVVAALALRRRGRAVTAAP